MATPIPDNRATFTLAEVASACGGRLSAGADGSLRVSAVVTDSRRVKQGCLFVALRGESFDAHSFLEAVRDGGAGAAVVRDDATLPEGLPAVLVPDTLRALGDLAAFHRQRWGGLVVGITGSAGKTTTKELTHAALCVVSDGGEAAVARTTGNLNNLIGVPMTLFTLQEGHNLAVIEMGTSQPGEIARLAQIASPQVGVVTAVAVAHAEGLGSLTGVAREKASLLWALPQEGTAIYNGDSEPLAAELSPVTCKRLSFGSGQGSTFRLARQAVVAGAKGFASVCRYRVPDTEDELEVPLAMIGQGPALDAAAALAVVHALLGPSAVQAAAAGLGRVPPVLGRMCPAPGPRGSLVLDDTYNANPASVLSSLRSLVLIAKGRGGRAIAALGDMKELGELAAAEHAAVGRACAQLGVSSLFTLGTDMRAALSEARTAGIQMADAATDVRDMARRLVDLLQPQDVVLVKGSRSMAMEQVVEGLVKEANKP